MNEAGLACFVFCSCSPLVVASPFSILTHGRKMPLQQQPDRAVQIHHKYMKEICKRFLFRRLKHDTRVAIEAVALFHWLVYPHTAAGAVMLLQCCLKTV